MEGLLYYKSRSFIPFLHFLTFLSKMNRLYPNRNNKIIMIIMKTGITLILYHTTGTSSFYFPTSSAELYVCSDGLIEDTDVLDEDLLAIEFLLSDLTSFVDCNILGSKCLYYTININKDSELIFDFSYTTKTERIQLKYNINEDAPFDIYHLTRCLAHPDQDGFSIYMGEHKELMSIPSTKMEDILTLFKTYGEYNTTDNSDTYILGKLPIEPEEKTHKYQTNPTLIYFLSICSKINKQRRVYFKTNYNMGFMVIIEYDGFKISLYVCSINIPVCVPPDRQNADA